MVYSRDERIDRLRNRGGWDEDTVSDEVLGEIIDDVVCWLNQYGQEDYDVVTSCLAEAIITSKGFTIVQFMIASSKVADGVNYKLGELSEQDSPFANTAIRIIREEESHLQYLMRAFDMYLIEKDTDDYEQIKMTHRIYDEDPKGTAHLKRALDFSY